MNRPKSPQATGGRTRVCAVSFLNTVPLIHGMLHGPQRNVFDLSFGVPSAVADSLESGTADIGIVPCAELDRLQLEYLPETGIACRGPVRSILLITKRRPQDIRTLAGDLSSRSSVMLARIIVAERYGATPQVISMPPDPERMLEACDAALLIGDPALKVDVDHVPYQVLDLGGEWVSMTGLPMVFAVWAGAQEHITAENGRVFVESLRYGTEHLDEIAEAAPRTHGIPTEMARKYLTEHIVFELGEPEHKGLALFRKKVAEIRARA